MSSLLFWLFLHSISVSGGQHNLFWPSLFVLAIIICSGRHSLVQDIDGASAKIIIAFCYVSYFLYGKSIETRKSLLMMTYLLLLNRIIVVDNICAVGGLTAVANLYFLSPFSAFWQEFWPSSNTAPTA